MAEDKGHFSLDRSTKWSKKTKSLLHSHRSPGRLGKTIHLNGSFVRRRIFCVLLLVVVPIYLFYSRQVARFYKPFFCAYIRSFWLRRPFSVVDAHAFKHYIRRYYSSYVNDFISLQRMLRFSVTLLIRKKCHFSRISYVLRFFLSSFRRCFCGFCYIVERHFSAHVWVYHCAIYVWYVLDTMTNHSSDFDISNFFPLLLCSPLFARCEDATVVSHFSCSFRWIIAVE